MMNKDSSESLETEETLKMIEKRRKEKSGFEKNTRIGSKIAIISLIAVIVLFLIIKIYNTKSKFTIKFDTCGGEEISEQIVKRNELVSKPNNPTKEGYEFLGWYVKDKEYDFNSKVTHNLTLCAKWESLNKADVSGVKLDQIEMALLPNDKVPLVATVEPSDAKNKEVSWKSSDESVATVDSDGNVEAKKIGVATIYVTTKEGDFTDKCIVVVSYDVIKVSGITTSENSFKLGIGDTKKIGINIEPSNATNPGVVWESDNTKVATVNSLGVVTGVKEGDAIITVKTKDGGYTEKIKVSVKFIELKKISFESNSETIGVKESKKLKYSLNPSDSTATLVWKSSDENIVKVDDKGKIYGVKDGKAIISVYSKNDDEIKSSIEVKVVRNIDVTDIKLSLNNLTMYIGDKKNLSVTISPKDATNKGYEWVSSNPNIASVYNGVITANRKGTTTITVKSSDGKHTDKCIVTVNEKEKIYTYKLTCNGDKCNISIFENSNNITNRISNVLNTNIKGNGTNNIEFSKEESNNIKDNINVVINGQTINVKKG